MSFTRKIIPFLLFAFFLQQSVNAQQDPMFTKYMFNSLTVNPGYAGSKEYISITALYRNQWWGIDGSPVTQSVTAHSPLNDKVGVGLSIVNDKLGATGSTVANASYAYRIPFGQGKISVGLQAGVMNYRTDFSVLNYRDPQQNDPSFDDADVNLFMPNFGVGVYYYAEKYYLGFSIPHLINSDLRRDEDIVTNKWAQQYRHYYFTGGMAIPVRGDAIVFKPSFLIKNVGLFEEFASRSSSLKGVGAPTEFDIDASFLFYRAFWIGASFRSSFEAIFGKTSSVDSANIWGAYNLRNGFRIGASYDYTLTKLQSYATGSFEIMLGYDFNFNKGQIVTPRYF